jgi:hypothetical protein
MAGAIIAAICCLLVVVKTVYGWLMGAQVFSIISVSTRDTNLLPPMMLLSGFVEFCTFAALVVTFVRVSALYQENEVGPTAADNRPRE